MWQTIKSVPENRYFDAVREREKLKSLGEQAHGEFNALGIQEVFQQIMAISRKRQYQLLTSNGKEENRDYEMVDTCLLEMLRLFSREWRRIQLCSHESVFSGGD